MSTNEKEEFSYKLKENEEFKITIGLINPTRGGGFSTKLNEYVVEQLLRTIEESKKLEKPAVLYVNSGFTTEDGTEIPPKMQAVIYKESRGASFYQNKEDEV